MTPRTSAFKNWQFGVLPDTMFTFDASLASIGIGVGFSLSTFRFFLFREPDLRLLDLIMTLLQVRFRVL